MVVINAALINNLPTSLPSGVIVVYNVGAVDQVMLTAEFSIPSTTTRAEEFTGEGRASFALPYSMQAMNDMMSIAIELMIKLSQRPVALWR